MDYVQSCIRDANPKKTCVHDFRVIVVQDYMNVYTVRDTKYCMKCYSAIDSKTGKKYVLEGDK